MVTRNRRLILEVKSMARIGERVSWEDEGGNRQVASLVDYIPEVDVVLLRDDYGNYMALNVAEIEQGIEYEAEA
jgi:hypothetical protein